ncbi:MAG: hypothetical protein IPG79_13715 [Saprospiraceae bacterium]|nr:hypothetical protein [Saprospiraceae bacterium]
MDANRDLILVEMPGIDNPQRARQYLQASAQLEFWDVYRATDAGITQSFVEVDNRLKGSVSADTNNVEMDTVYKEKYDELGNVIDSVLTVVPKNSSKDSTRGPLLNAITLNSGNLYPTTIALVDKSKKTFVMEILAREDVKPYFQEILSLCGHISHNRMKAGILPITTNFTSSTVILKNLHLWMVK